MSDIGEIREAIANLFKRMRTTAGYKTAIADANISSYFFAGFVKRTAPTDYPKLYVVMESGENQQQVGNRTRKSVDFQVVFVDRRKNDADKHLQERVENFLEDVDKAVALDHTLSNTVINCTMTEFVTDGGLLDPEGVAIINLKVLFDVSY